MISRQPTAPTKQVLLNMVETPQIGSIYEQSLGGVPASITDSIRTGAAPPDEQDRAIKVLEKFWNGTWSDA